MNSLLRKPKENLKLKKEVYYPRIGDTIYAERIKKRVNHNTHYIEDVPYGDLVPSIIKWFDYKEKVRVFNFWGLNNKEKNRENFSDDGIHESHKDVDTIYYNNYFLLPILKVNAKMLLTEKL